MAPHPESTVDNGNTFEDLSGIASSLSDNPYDTLIDACKNQTEEIQARYAKHRETRNGVQTEKFRSKAFSGVSIDSTLHKLVNPERYPNFADTRHCLVFWARPPSSVKSLIADLQQQLLTVAPSGCVRSKRKG
ncbi:MAG: hypothetical protein Q9224_005679 [Gallowayella concinna]